MPFGAILVSAVVAASYASGLACHSATPTQPGFTAPPNGVAFDTPDQIRARASTIYQRAVVARDMPPGNLTNMTTEERELVGGWFQQGARTG